MEMGHIENNPINSLNRQQHFAECISEKGTFWKSSSGKDSVHKDLIVDEDEGRSKEKILKKSGSNHQTSQGEPLSLLHALHLGPDFRFPHSHTWHLPWGSISLSNLTCSKPDSSFLSGNILPTVLSHHSQWKIHSSSLLRWKMLVSLSSISHTPHPNHQQVLSTLLHSTSFIWSLSLPVCQSAVDYCSSLLTSLLSSNLTHPPANGICSQPAPARESRYLTDVFNEGDIQESWKAIISTARPNILTARPQGKPPTVPPWSSFL